ncbi:Serine/threonine-protein kinase PKH2 [Candida viswanathii]|uniref:non-specific serine/threonine protein kinase n=1 Tax=Candida viswanathii TaxID=5486 RepID=A0A367YD93_9ASCO|nr:Serine/threonine-protein kinase PKH2 [Candida viswanathii]
MTLPTFRYSFHHKNSKKEKQQQQQQHQEDIQARDDEKNLSPTSMKDIHDDLDDIYNNYTTAAQANNDSVDTLESEHNEPPPHAFIYKPPAQSQALPVVHISSRLSSLEDDTAELGTSLPKTDPGTPLSANSFDFRPAYPRAVTNSSLNVLLDSPNVSTDFNYLVDHTPTPEPAENYSQEPGEKEDEEEYYSNEADEEAEEQEEAEEEEALQELVGPSADEVEEEEESGSILDAPELKKNQQDWERRGSAVKTVHTPAGETKVIRRSVTDFKFGKELGEGSYSTVILATDKITSKQYAVKVLDKRHIIKEKKVKYVNIEKHALNRLSDRLGIISLYFTFQDKDSLYFVLDYASNGELLTLIKKYNTLNEDSTRHFGAQILDGIKYMHDNGVIHRDLKPENILIDDHMRIRITDFGTARLLEKKNDESHDYPIDVRAKSFVGTAEYVSPELLESKYCGKPGDIWAYGCIIYQMIAGKPPFKATNEYLTFQKITKLQYAFSAGFPTIIRDLIKKILVLQPSKRATIPEIQNHYFFQSVDFNDFDLIWLSEPPEIGPYKMTAKSMMKIPELKKTPAPAARKKVVKKAAAAPQTPKVRAKPKAATPSSAAAPTTAGNGTNGTSPAPAALAAPARRMQTPAHNNNSSDGVNAASVAAFVLNKPQTNSDTNISEDSPKGSSSSETKDAAAAAAASTTTKRTTHAPADYIPGTNILRPQIATRAPIASYARPSAATRERKSLTRQPLNQSQPQKADPPKPQPMEVTPMTTLEAAWGSYLTHPDERVIRIGPVIAHKEPTEPFEKRNKASLHASPLNLKNATQRNRSNTSLMAQLVNGANNNSLDLQNNENADESLAILEPQYNMKRSSTTSSGKNSVDLQRSGSTSGGSSSKLGKKSFFKKLGFSHIDKHENDEPQVPSLNDRPQTCTMVVTTHGRALLFIRDESESGYLLLAEIRLKYPFIHFQELVASQSKLSKMLPSVGVFVISSIENSLVFEVETFEVNPWTEALAKSKFNEIERQKLAEYESQQTKKDVIVAPVPKRLSPPSAVASPKLLDSPAFETMKKANTQIARRSGDIKTTSSPTQSPREHNSRATHMLKTKILTSGPRRKPPPLSPPPTSPESELNHHTGLPNKSNSNGMLHAAKLAVSQNTQVSHYPNHRRSSFTKEDGSKVDLSKLRTQNNQTNGTKPQQGVTQMNSKFLARSTRKK